MSCSCFNGSRLASTYLTAGANHGRDHNLRQNPKPRRQRSPNTTVNRTTTITLTVMGRGGGGGGGGTVLHYIITASGAENAPPQPKASFRVYLVVFLLETSLFLLSPWSARVIHAIYLPDPVTVARSS